MTNPHSNIQIQLTSRWDHEFLLTQYCLFTKRAGFNFNRIFHFLSSQNLLNIIIYLSFFFFVFTAAVIYN